MSINRTAVPPSCAGDGLPIGPMLLGMSKPIHVVVPSVTARGIVNLSALAVVEAQGVEAQEAAEK